MCGTILSNTTLIWNSVLQERPCPNKSSQNLGHLWKGKVVQDQISMSSALKCFYKELWHEVGVFVFCFVCLFF